MPIGGDGGAVEPASKIINKYAGFARGNIQLKINL